MERLYLAHFGLERAPFSITPDPRFFFPGAGRGDLLRAIEYSVRHQEGIVVVTGEVGSGKTMLCRKLLDALPPDLESIYLANPSLRRREITAALLRGRCAFHTLAAARAATAGIVRRLLAEQVRENVSGGESTG